MRGRLRLIPYWVQYGLLTVLGPAQQDSEHDPIEILRRKYNRPRRSGQ